MCGCMRYTLIWGVVKPRLYNHYPMQGQDLLADPTALLKAIVGCLTQLLPKPDPPDSSSLFNLKGTPTISIADYLARMSFSMQGS